jgi:predicted DCC family thiol-disulfide oxidoreductase YuxK
MMSGRGSAAARDSGETRMRQKALILYDGQCRVCLASVGQLRRLDWLGRLDYGDARDAAVREKAGGVDREAALRRLHLVPPRGKPLEGFHAFRWLAGRLPALWILWPFLWIPGVTALGVRAYDAFARNRFAFGACDGDACVRK